MSSLMEIVEKQQEEISAIVDTLQTIDENIIMITAILSKMSKERKQD